MHRFQSSNKSYVPRIAIGKKQLHHFKPNISLSSSRRALYQCFFFCNGSLQGKFL
uniref:Uncharacterized protein n=1 Tax=Ciona intestinalis TaxID=7719 RepID=H2XUF6_CIOIN